MQHMKAPGAFLISVALAGCATEAPSADAESDTSADGNLGASQAALGGSEEFSWAQGQTYTPMGSEAGRACFLTRVTVVDQVAVQAREIVDPRSAT
jgi:hypothetical protein